MKKQACPYAYGDVPELAASLRRLAQDPSLRREMGNAGRRRVATYYSIEAYVSGVMKILVGQPVIYLLLTMAVLAHRPIVFPLALYGSEAYSGDSEQKSAMRSVRHRFSRSLQAQYPDAEIEVLAGPCKRHSAD